MDSTVIQISFLITKEDYLSMELEKQHWLTPKENKVILCIIGLTALCCGTAAFFGRPGSLYHQFGLLLLILTGFYAISYYDLVKPFLIKKQAERFYEKNHRNIGSQIVRFYEDRFEMTAENRSLHIPYRYLYKIVEGNKILLLFTDKNESVFLPKRVLSEQQLFRIRSICHEKYVHL